MKELLTITTYKLPTTATSVPRIFVRNRPEYLAQRHGTDDRQTGDSRGSARYNCNTKLGDEIRHT